MNNYDVVIRETLQMTVTVSAESMAEAKALVEDKWVKSEYVLDASHFKDVAISTLYPNYRNYER